MKAIPLSMRRVECRIGGCSCLLSISSFNHYICRMIRPYRIRRIVCLMIILYPLMARAGDAPCQISGRVVDPAGRPVPEVAVRIVAIDVTGLTDPEGYFSFQGVPAGVYDLTFRRYGFRQERLVHIRIPEDGSVRLEPVILAYRVIDLAGDIVTATRTARHPDEISKSFNRVGERAILERESKSSAEALREEPGLFVQKTGHGGGSAIVRGLSSNQILIMVDGIRLNNSTYRLGNHPYMTLVDNFLAERIEVIRGPSSVLYGSDALGGAINLVTREPDPGEEGTALRLFGRTASADGEKTLHADARRSLGNIGFQAGFTVKDFGDLRRGGDSDHPELERSTDGLVQRPTGFHAYDVDAGAVYEPTADQQIKLAWQMTRRRDVPRYDKYENNDYYRWLYQPQERDLAYFRYKRLTSAGWLDAVESTISLHRQLEGREIQQAADSELTLEEDRVWTTGLTLQMNSTVREHRLTYGADIYLDRVRSGRSVRNPLTGVSVVQDRGRYPDGAVYNSAGIFLQDEMPLGHAIDLTASARFSRFWTSFTVPPDTAAAVEITDVDQRFQAITGSLGGVFRPDEWIQLTFNISQAFRAPNLSDLEKMGESKGSTFEVPNPDLEPERMIGTDAGVRLNPGRWEAAVTFHAGWLSDMIASADATWNGQSTIEQGGRILKVKQKENIGEALIYGIESGGRLRLSRQVTLRGNLTATYGENRTLDEPVGGIPPLFGLVGLRWGGEDNFLDFFTRFAAKQDRLSTDDRDDPRIPVGGTPGWLTWNLRSGVDLGRFGDLRVGIENLLDLNYREHGSGINGPGRNFIVSLEVTG